ncbi:MAG: DinB family protein [Bacteroidota bacterium]
MEFNLNKSISILERTPAVLRELLTGLQPEWLHGNEGKDTWSPYQVLGHLIHGEKTDWVVRAKIILSDLPDKTFEPFDRFAQDKDNSKPTLDYLLDTFENFRKANLSELKNLKIDESSLGKTGKHPALGVVSLKELLSTWTVHDLGHIAQITRVMAKQYQEEVGPWKAYLGILKK